MHPTAASFREAVEETFDFAPDVHEFPEGTKTAADAAEAVGCDLEQIAKGIVMAVDGDLVLVLTSGANRVDEAALAEYYDRPATAVSSADPDQVKATTGWSIGGVPPFVHDTGIDVLLDPTLLECETVWAAAGTPEAVFPIDPETLRDLAEATVVDVFE